jgi:hypothetical protein
MNKPDWTKDPALLAYLQALQQPTPNITPMPGDGIWNNHPKLNMQQQRFHAEQQHMMRTEWQLMQERRLEEERQLTQAHGIGYDGGGEVNFSYDGQITYGGPENDLLFEGGSLTFAN